MGELKVEEQGRAQLIDKLEGLLTQSLQDKVRLKNELRASDLAKQDLFKEMLLNIISVVDAHERIEKSYLDKGIEASDPRFKVIKRYRMTHKRLIKILAEYGVHKLTFPENKLILDSVKSLIQSQRSKDNDELIEVLRDGYIRGKESIRDAEVIIVKN